jgi:hypothetical protein
MQRAPAATTVERQQQREGEVIRQLRCSFHRKAFGIEDRLRQPGADIDFPLRLCAFEPVETKTRHHGDEESLGIVNVARAREAQIGVLDDIFGIGAAAEHAIGQPKQPTAVGRQRIAVMQPV